MPTSFYQRSAMAMAIAACFPAAGYAAGVARVDFAVGNVTAQGADGRTRQLTRGSEVEVGDTVNTQQGRAQLRFQDGAFMSLQPETAFKVEQFRFTENGGGNDSIVMNLLKGGMRTITGLIGRANRSNYKFRTEVATIGIRGTEYAVRYTNSIEVFCAGGAIDIVNEGGTLVLGTGQGGFVQNPTQEPQRTEERPFLPPTAASGTEDPQAQIAPPVNPVQEALSGGILTGTFEGSWAVAHLSRGASSATGLPVTLDGSGALTSFVNQFEGPGTESPNTVGTGAAQSTGNDGIIAWGRWVNGVSGGSGSFSNLNLDLPEGALHYVVGLPATNLPKGQATYDMMGSTAPTLSGLSSVSLDKSSIVVDFDRSNALLNAQFTVNGSSILKTAAGGAPINLSGAQLFGSASGGSFTGPFCSQSLSVTGFLAGDGATRAGLAYDLFTTNGSAIGTVAYKKTTP
jgi:hypothetical protein